MMVHVSVILISFYFTLCAGGLSHIFKGKTWLKGVQLIAKPIILDDGHHAQMTDMKNMEDGNKMDDLKLLILKSIFQDSLEKPYKEEEKKPEENVWKVDDIKGWETPKMEDKEKEKVQSPKSEEKPWALVQLKDLPMELPKMMMKPEDKGWEILVEPNKMTKKPEMEPPKVMMMMKPEIGWAPQPEVEEWKQIPIKAWEAPVQSPKMTMAKPESKDWEAPLKDPKMMNEEVKAWELSPEIEKWKTWQLPLDPKMVAMMKPKDDETKMTKPKNKGGKPPMEPPKMMMKPETKGWEPPMEPPKMMTKPEIKSWEPPMEPPKMMIKSEVKGWEPPMEPPKQSKKWILVQVKESKPKKEPAKSKEMKEDPWKIVEDAIKYWHQFKSENDGKKSEEPWKTKESQNKPYILGFDTAIKSGSEERENSYWRGNEEERYMETQNKPVIILSNQNIKLPLTEQINPLL